jgi:hypothetical protein
VEKLGENKVNEVLNLNKETAIITFSFCFSYFWRYRRQRSYAKFQNGGLQNKNKNKAQHTKYSTVQKKLKSKKF